MLNNIVNNYRFPFRGKERSFNYAHPIHSNWSKDLSEFLNSFGSFLDEGDWAIDFGAASGDSSLILGSLVGPNGKVICFEPGPMYELLNNNIKLNPNLAVFDTYQLAAWNNNEIRRYIYSHSWENGALIDGFEEYRGGIEEGIQEGRVIETQCVKIYEFLLSKYKLEYILSKVKLIKFDTEGCDLILLKELISIITVSKPTLIIEWWADESTMNGVFELLKPLGYKFYRDDTREELNSLSGPALSHDIICVL